MQTSMLPLAELHLDLEGTLHPPSKFARVFERAGAEELHCVDHAGEEGPSSQVWETLDVLDTERIDHGNRCLDDQLLDELDTALRGQTQNRP